MAFHTSKRPPPGDQDENDNSNARGSSSAHDASSRARTRKKQRTSLTSERQQEIEGDNTLPIYRGEAEAEERKEEAVRTKCSVLDAAPSSQDPSEHQSPDKRSSKHFELLLTSVGTFGSRGTGNGQFRNPYYITTDLDGNTYVSDCDNHRVQMFEVYSNAWKRSIGSKGRERNQFLFPHGITINSVGKLIVCDGDNHCIHVFDQSLSHEFSFGSHGISNGLLDCPSGIDVDSNDNIYVVDTNNHRVQIFAPDGTYLTSIGSGHEGSGWKMGGSEDGQFNTPSDIALCSTLGLIFVSDEQNHRIQVFALADGHPFLFKIGSKGKGHSEFDQPEGLVVTSTGLLIVCDMNNGRLQVFLASDGTFVTSIERDPLGEELFKSPSGVAVANKKQSPHSLLVTDICASQVRIIELSELTQIQEQ